MVRKPASERTGTRAERFHDRVQEETAHDPARQPARLLRWRRSCHPDCRARHRALRPAGLCPPRDRAQSLRRRRPRGQGGDLRRRARRGAGRPPRRVLRPRRAEGGAGRGRTPQAALCRRHLPAGLQGPSRGRAAPRGRAHHRADRPRRPSRGDRHHGPASRRRRAAGRGHRAGRAAGSARSAQPCLRDADDIVGRRHDRASWRRCGVGSRPSRVRRWRTSATPRPTGRRR